MIKLFENYNEIAHICQKYNIKNWSLNPDGSIDVVGDVNLNNNNLTKLPLKFGRVKGYFDFRFNKLINLDGAPREVGNDFYCNSNKLTTLEGAPRDVAGSFYCDNNNLTTLEGCPREVGGDFYCKNNNNLPEYLIKFMELNGWSQLIIKQIVKWQDEYELWKDPEKFKGKFKWMMEDIQENDLPDIKIKFPKDD